MLEGDEGKMEKRESGEELGTRKKGILEKKRSTGRERNGMRSWRKKEEAR